MTLNEWFKGQPHGAGHKVARDLGIHYVWLSSLRRGKKHPSPELARQIEAYTGGAVTSLEMATAEPVKRADSQPKRPGRKKPQCPPIKSVIRGYFPGATA